MARYRVHFVNTLSSYVEVEAEDEAQAREVADEQFAYPTLCAHCAGWRQDWSVDDGEWFQDDDPGSVTEVTEDGAR
jgi:hypothetical protein